LGEEVIHRTEAAVEDGVASTPVGASGAAAMNTAVDGTEGLESPTRLVATTVKVEERPVTSPVTTQVRAGGPTSALVVHCLVGSSTEVTVYPVTAAPLAAAVDHDTVARASPATAVIMSGAVGTATGTTAGEGAEAVDVPTRFVAVATNVYVVPLVSPVIVQVLTPSPPSGTV
jgi:hypothetical protein